MILPNATKASLIGVIKAGPIFLKASQALGENNRNLRIIKIWRANCAITTIRQSHTTVWCVAAAKRMHHRNINLRNGRSRNRHISALVFEGVSGLTLAVWAESETIGAGVGAKTMDLTIRWRGGLRHEPSISGPN